jgi:PIN domain nuclease of toxin-antitoxin system
VSECVLDASALLAMLQGETGSNVVLRHASESWISAVNMVEVYGKLMTRGGISRQSAIEIAFGAVKGVAAFNDGQARLAAELLDQTRALGLSLGDRACLALGLQRQLPVLTADKVWKSLRLGVEIRVIR